MNKRVFGYDLARAFAIFGMVIVNFKVVMNVSTGTNWLYNAANLLEGRAAAVFVVLAGVGISLLTKKAFLNDDLSEIKKKRVSLLKRSILLIVIGLAYSPIWPADILHFYGLYIIVGSFLLMSSNRVLLLFIFFFTIMFVALLGFVDYETGWNWETLNYIDFWTINGMVRHLFYNGFHPVFPWTAFLLIGMWLGRKDVSNMLIRRKLIIISAIVWILTELLSDLAISYGINNIAQIPTAEISEIFGTKPMPPMPQYIIAGSSSAIFFILICVSISLKIENSRLLKPLYYTGQLALTFYVAHVIIGMGFLESIGMLENQTIDFAIFTAISFNILCIIFAYFWKSKFAVGPLEWVFRKAAK